MQAQVGDAMRELVRMDLQSKVFREATAEDWVTDAQIAEEYEAAPDAPSRTREEYDAEGWDAERTGPKTLAEAQEIDSEAYGSIYGPA